MGLESYFILKFSLNSYFPALLNLFQFKMAGSRVKPIIKVFMYVKTHKSNPQIYYIRFKDNNNGSAFVGDIPYHHGCFYNYLIAKANIFTIFKYRGHLRKINKV